MYYKYTRPSKIFYASQKYLRPPPSKKNCMLSDQTPSTSLVPPLGLGCFVAII